MYVPWGCQNEEADCFQKKTEIRKKKQQQSAAKRARGGGGRGRRIDRDDEHDEHENSTPNPTRRPSVGRLPDFATARGAVLLTAGGLRTATPTIPEVPNHCYVFKDWEDSGYPFGIIGRKDVKRWKCLPTPAAEESTEPLVFVPTGRIAPDEMFSSKRGRNKITHRLEKSCKRVTFADDVAFRPWQSVFHRRGQHSRSSSLYSGVGESGRHQNEVNTNNSKASVVQLIAGAQKQLLFPSFFVSTISHFGLDRWHTCQ